MKRTNFKVWRAKYGLTQEDVAKALGVTVGYVNRVENGYIEPSFKFLKTFKKVYKIGKFDDVLETFDMND